LVIPTRHFDVKPSDYYNQLEEFYVTPFLQSCHRQGTSQKLLLTVIVSQQQLRNENNRDQLLNWVTSLSDIDGVYLIFENNISSKQIKDAGFICDTLIFIELLKNSDLEVHVGYTNTEGLLYALANADSITMGSYENLRQFSIKRFSESENKPMSPPKARLYSRQLLQWVDYGYLDAIRALYNDWDSIFEDSKYRPLMFQSEYNWHFSKPEPYKHFFLMFASQVEEITNESSNLFHFMIQKINDAMEKFRELEYCGVILDENSDGSHLSYWLTAINMFERYLRERNGTL
jgi:hypothetical protein